MDKTVSIGFFGNFGNAFKGIVGLYDIRFVIFEEQKSNKYIENFCKLKGIKIFHVKNRNEIFNIIKHFSNVDLFIVASFGIIFDKNILNQPKLDTINIHPGILPEYRGRHPLPQAILNKEIYMGLTSHIMNLEIDSGKILHIVKIPIDYQNNYRYNEKKLLQVLPSFVVESIENYFLKKYISVQGKEKYYKPLKKVQLDRIMNAQKLEDIEHENSN